MKIRRGFVSNSSSSSFMCEACNEVVEDYDSEYTFECINGHIMCENCADYEGDHQHDMPSDKCKICKKEIVPDYMIMDYFYKTLGIDRAQAVKLVRGDLDIFKIFEGINKNENKK